MKEYALYKGDEFICLGTLEEIAKHQNVKYDSIRFLLYPTYQKRCKSNYNNRKIFIEIEDDSESEVMQ